jgi:hypothetical protein
VIEVRLLWVGLSCVCFQVSCLSANAEQGTIQKRGQFNAVVSPEACVKNGDLQYGVFAEALYFKAIEDSLKYAERFPQNATFTPQTSGIDQKFSYEPGFRVGVVVPIHYDQWQLKMTWMSLESRPPARHAYSNDFSIFASLDIPDWGASGNSFVQKMTGRWKLGMNVVDLRFQRLFSPSKGFYVAPSGGVMSGFIDQSIRVHYQSFRIDFPQDNTPLKLLGRSNMWSVGPVMGVDFGCRLPGDFSLFFNGSIACLAGIFSLETKYEEFINAPPGSEVKIKDSDRRVFIVEQFQSGLRKKWMGRRFAVELVIGWELQVWSRQMRLKWFSSFAEPPDPSDLSLYGPFFRAMVRF